MEERIPWGKIQYYLKNDHQSLDEEFTSWLYGSQANLRFWEEIKLAYSLTGELPTRSLKPDMKSAWAKVNKRISLNERKNPLGKLFFRIAASILLVMFGASASWLIMHPQNIPVYTEIYSPYGHKTMVLLPDSSKVWLNGNSRLKYETSFVDSRRVELSGEALFKVKKDKTRIFSVQSGDLKVEVYGTTFNFKNYQEEEHAEVALLEGSVGLFNNNQFLKKMVPGDVADYDLKTSSVQMSHRNLEQVISWSTDELILDNEKFAEVVKYLERWYGVEITVADNMDINQRLSFKVKTESLQELLSIINRIVPVNYKINGKKVIISKK